MLSGWSFVKLNVDKMGTRKLEKIPEHSPVTKYPGWQVVVHCNQKNQIQNKAVQIVMPNQQDQLTIVHSLFEVLLHACDS